jgi:hypothetical protein
MLEQRRLNKLTIGAIGEDARKRLPGDEWLVLRWHQRSMQVVSMSGARHLLAPRAFEVRPDVDYSSLLGPTSIWELWDERVILGLGGLLKRRSSSVSRLAFITSTRYIHAWRKPVALALRTELIRGRLVEGVANIACHLSELLLDAPGHVEQVLC